MSIDTKSRIINLIATGVLIAAIATMSVGLLKGFMTGTQANVIVGAALAIFWFMTDVLETFVCKRFDNITIEMRAAYLKFILLDLAGYAGILYFLVGVGGSNGQSSGLLGAVIYVVSMKPKRKQQRIFLGLETEEEEVTEEESKDEGTEE